MIMIYGMIVFDAIAVLMLSKLTFSSTHLQVCRQLCSCDKNSKTVSCHGQLEANQLLLLRLPSFPVWVETLEIHNYHITELVPYAFPGLMNLKRLSLNRNHLRRIDPFAFTQVTNLTVLDLSDNDFDDIPSGLFLEMPKLNELHLAYTNLKNYSSLHRSNFHKHVSLEVIRLANCPLMLLTGSEPIRLPDVVTLDLSGTTLDKISEDRFYFVHDAPNSIPMQINLPHLRRLHIDNARVTLDSKFMRDFAHLEYLSASDGVRLQETSLQAVKDWLNIKTLILNGASIEWTPNTAKIWAWVPLSVSHLELSGLGLRRVDFGSVYLPELTYLRVDDNYLPTFDLSPLINLLELSVANNSLTKLPTCDQALQSIQILNVAFNRIVLLSSTHFKCTPNLRSADFSHNAIEHVETTVFDAVKQLQVLDLGFNRLISLALDTRIESLETLILSSNYFHWEYEEPVQIDSRHAKVPKLKRLDLSNNPYLLHSSRKCTSQHHACWPNWLGALVRLARNLEHLSLANTSLYAWPLNEFLLLTKLKTLDVSYNHVTLTALQLPWNGSIIDRRIDTLRLVANNLTSLPTDLVIHLAHYAHRVDVRQNPFSCECHLPESLRVLGANLTSKDHTCFSRDTDTEMTVGHYVMSRDRFCGGGTVAPVTLALILMSVLIPATCSLVCSVLCLWKLRKRKRQYRGGPGTRTQSRILDSASTEQTYTLLAISPTNASSDEDWPVDL